jgi:arylsulfatase
MEPHGPYAPPKGWPRPFSDPDFRGPDWAIKGDVNPAERAFSTAGPGAADPRVVAHLRDLYDDEIAYFDEQFGRLLDELEGLGLLDKTLLVLTADHGEQFLEHGQLKHCKDVYDEELRVPMLIRPPGGTSGRRVATAVSNLDVVPTILAWAGGDVTSLAKAPLEGRSLRPLIDETKRSKPDTSGSRSRPPGAAFSAWVGSRAITDGRWKLIYRIPQQRFELYDLWLDPAETIDQAERAPRELRRLRHRLLGWMSDHEDDALGKGTGRLDERARDRLKAVGYLQ